MQEMFKTRLFWLMLCISLLLPLCVVTAQDEGDDDDDDDAAEVNPDDWKKERAEIEKAITAEVKKRVEAKVTYQKIVEDIGKRADVFEKRLKPGLLAQRKAFLTKESARWKKDFGLAYPKVDYDNIVIPKWVWPIKGEMPTSEKLKEALEKMLEESFRAANPEKSEKELTKEGHEKYKMVRIVPGEPEPFVTLKLRAGKGTNTKAEGRLSAVTPEHLRVGIRWINRLDLDEETCGMFYKDVNERLVKDYVYLEQRKYRAMLESFVVEWVMYLLPDELMKHNYIPLDYLRSDRLRVSPNMKKWVLRKDMIKRAYDFQYKREYDKQMKIVEPDFFKHATEKFGYEENYEYVKEKKEWMPNTVAAAFREEQQRKLEAEKNKQQGRMGPEGMPEGMPPGPPM